MVNEETNEEHSFNDESITPSVDPNDPDFDMFRDEPPNNEDVLPPSAYSEVPQSSFEHANDYEHTNTPDYARPTIDPEQDTFDQDQDQPFVEENPNTETPTEVIPETETKEEAIRRIIGQKCPCRVNV